MAMKAAAICAVLLVACGGDGTPQLISVHDLMPREAEVGDKLQISGEGFPQGRAAHVRFHGTAHRPGLPDERAEIETMGTAIGPSTVEIDFDEALESQFCGVGKLATHTTFSGDVEVAFSPAMQGAPPVAGLAHGAELDVRPPMSSTLLETARDEGARTLAALGIRSTGDARSGLVVASIDPGSRAESAGLLAGDVIVSWAGVRVGSLADVALASGANSIRVGLRRGASPNVQAHEIMTAGVAAKGTVDVLAAVLAIAFALGIALALGAKRPAWLVRLESKGMKTRVDFVGIACAVIAAMAPWALVAIAHVDLDFPLAFCIPAAALVATALVSRKEIVRALVMLVPFALSLFAVAYSTGALRIGDAVRAQGVLPWHWQAARDPMSIPIALLALAPFAMGGTRGLLQLVERLVLGLVASTLALAFFGGWATPRAFESATLVGGVLHLAKCTIAIAIVMLAREAAVLDPKWLVRRILPASLVATLASLGIAELAPPHATRYFVAVLALAVPIGLGILVRALRPKPRWIPSAMH